MQYHYAWSLLDQIMSRWNHNQNEWNEWGDQYEQDHTLSPYAEGIRYMKSNNIYAHRGFNPEIEFLQGIVQEAQERIVELKENQMYDLLKQKRSK